MPFKYTSIDQVIYLKKWFDSWSELQKEDFLPILAESVNPQSHINGLTESISDETEERKKPTIFDCQIKLFKEWYVTWEENNRLEFRNHIQETDEIFFANLEKVIKSDLIEKHNDLEHLESDQTLTLSPLSINESDDHIAGHSSSSSPLSSLTQSNTDSGMEANKSDGEPTKEEN